MLPSIRYGLLYRGVDRLYVLVSMFSLFTCSVKYYYCNSSVCFDVFFVFIVLFLCISLGLLFLL